MWPLAAQCCVLKIYTIDHKFPPLIFFFLNKHLNLWVTMKISRQIGVRATQKIKQEL